jgi:hypothetical protein
MSLGIAAWAAQTTWTSHRRADHNRRSRVAGLAQAGALVSLVFTVAAALCLRHTRAAAMTRQEELAEAVQESLYGVLRVPSVSRAAFAAESPMWGSRLESAPAVADARQVKLIMPEGQVCEVVVKGGLTGRLKDRGSQYHTCVAYAFEMRYQGLVESNDGRRIVERRDYGNVRMAKLLSLVADMRLELGEPDAPLLDELSGCSDPGSGIAVASVGLVAKAILSGDTEAVTGCPASRAFLEEDLLSGKSVRLNHTDGVGVTAIEPVGWTLTRAVAAYLFRQTIVPLPLLHDSSRCESAEFVVPSDHLGAFLDPSRWLDREDWIGIAAPTKAYDASPGCQLFLRPWSRARWGPHSDSHRPRTAVVPLGQLQYDPIRKIVTNATVRWPLPALMSAHDRLLFETDFAEPPLLTVQYRCQIH